MTPDVRAALDAAHCEALAYLESLDRRPVAGPATADELAARFDRALPNQPLDPAIVIQDLAAAVDPGLVAGNGPRYFGFVTGGTLPGAMAADWLTSVWDQNTALWAMSPAAITVQNLAASWLLELLDLPHDAGVGFVTGAQMANWTCLAAARHRVLADAGWDVEAKGLPGAPAVTIVVGSSRHSTIDRALRFLGFGDQTMVVVASDDQGRMVPEALRDTLEAVDGPLIVCAQAGEVNTGAFDPFAEIIEATRERGGWVHVDGAFGLWARACTDRRGLAAGVERADSWSVDGHKWLNVPYDTGYAITADPEAHAAAMSQLAPYLVAEDDARRDPMNWSPDASRRARGFATYAAIRSLGRSGIDEMIDRCCRLARRFADTLRATDGVEILNDVVLNQVLVRFDDGVDADAHTRTVIQRVQREGTCWAGGTTFRGRAAMRLSVSNWSTNEGDIDDSAAAILRCADLA
jgi:glutamate/tyrosine decarboxylase-like PLP-dependent enzyme